MNAPPQPILDYASPRPHGKVRLPARSVLEVRSDADSVEVVERLAGKFGAIAAVLFSGMTLTVVVVSIWSEIARALWSGDPAPALFGLSFPVAGYVVML